MVENNCRTASEAGAGTLTEADFETLEKVKSAIREKEKVGCTGCRYCMPCPKGVDIPGIFRCYNTMYTESKSGGRSQFIQTVGLTREPAFASQCIRCGKCEQHCPQGIPIREKLQERKGWEPTTIKTLVSRLAGKGVISQEKCGVFYYKPLVSEQEYNEWVTNNLVDKVYQGNVKNLIAALVNSDGLTPEDLKELREMFRVEE